MQVTLDTNALIDLEEDRSDAVHIRRLIEANAAGRITLQVVAISASERKPGGRIASSYGEFKDKLSAIGLSNVKVLLPMAYADVGFLDWRLICDDAMIAKERAIHEVLFPGIEFEHGAFCASNGLHLGNSLAANWRNAKCDVQAMWSHIHNGGGIFVTRDANFLKPKKVNALVKLGAGAILTPVAAADAA